MQIFMRLTQPQAARCSIDRSADGQLVAHNLSVAKVHSIHNGILGHFNMGFGSVVVLPNLMVQSPFGAP